MLRNDAENIVYMSGSQPSWSHDMITVVGKDIHLNEHSELKEHSLRMLQYFILTLLTASRFKSFSNIILNTRIVFLPLFRDAGMSTCLWKVPIESRIRSFYTVDSRSVYLTSLFKSLPHKKQMLCLLEGKPRHLQMFCLPIYLYVLMRF